MGSLKNGLIALLDQAFPGVNTLFDTQPKRSNGHFKWVDFVRRFWHKDCVAGLSFAAFSDVYRKWCAKSSYRFSASDAEKIHRHARNAVATFSKSDSTKLLITQEVDSLNAVYDTLHILRGEMLRLASLLPEFEIVMAMYGAGEITGPPETKKSFSLRLERSILILYYSLGLKDWEIAALLCTSRSRVQRLRLKALNMLQEEMRR